MAFRLIVGLGNPGREYEETRHNVGFMVLDRLAAAAGAPESMLVIHDDAALPGGRLRFREKGSAGGHNGIKSIIAHLGTDAFPRLKIGIGSSQPGHLKGHVLGKFSPDERAALENTLATALEAVQLARSQGLAAAANRFHSLVPSPSTRTDEPQIPRPDCPEHQVPRRHD